MPELPEVETIRRDLEKEVLGLSILDLESNWPKRILPSLPKVKEKVRNKKILAVDRVSKLICFKLNNNERLLLHLKLTGQLLLRNSGAKVDPYVCHWIILNDGREIRFADTRKFGYLQLMGKEEFTNLTKSFGPEPIGTSLRMRDIYPNLSRKGSPIKTVLMDQSIFAGVGNIYANEALFLAGIDPRRKANSLSEAEVEKILHCLGDVLAEGLKYRGASDNTYVDLYGNKGKYQEHFRVYARKGHSCIKCGGQIHYTKVNQRGTFFCPKCQS